MCIYTNIYTISCICIYDIKKVVKTFCEFFDIRVDSVCACMRDVSLYRNYCVVQAFPFLCSPL